ncbi:bifunctional 3-(3-hydroxy-phenyl)propionate/3-hydroxycinnamic acid hydroxylase [Kocuria sp.]|uniref:bifunctional 3-(3-hydroxy-phenyl)propionate/3-hydroxycinnamic acid hydroxylase n=1 Tax=Kocuria TaxID=57493 RepID=UPI0025C02AC0|nr:bifunctional 3-(3-hydroxy-phenyl)propionate/3-hydroxycinnamic acid hydroxylase [Kocuria sp.]
MVDADVLVVGGGPVGEVLLTMLDARGVSAIGFERDRDVWPKPRAVHFDGETMRTFQSIGVGDALAEVSTPMRNYRMINQAGEVLLDFPTGFLGDQGWYDDVTFHQPDVDALLRARLQQLENVKLLTGVTVRSVSQTADGVTATVVDAGGAERTYTGRYLVGADGASSFVRHQLGIGYDELGPNDPWLVVDGVFREEPPQEHDMVFYGYHTRPRLWAALPGRRRRMEFKVLPGDDQNAIGSAEWVAAETGGLMRPDNFDIDRTAVYTFRSCLAPRWREGRIFLAGDAAHLAPPLFGQGLCSGIRDAANLSWKLALVLDGADEALLETYESERIPHVRAWIEQATRMSGFVQTTDAQIAAARDQHIREHPEDGVAAAPPLGPGFHVDAGRPSIQPLIDHGRFDDRVGKGFLVAAQRALVSTLPAAVLEKLNAAKHLQVLDESTPGVADLLTASGAAIAVVRPDRYLYGTAQSAQDAEELLTPVIDLLSSATSSHAA